MCRSVLQCVAVCCNITAQGDADRSVADHPVSFLDGYCTGWRRLVGCLKSQVIFRKRATNYRALFRNMTYEDKASYDSTPPCSTVQSLHGWFEVDLGFPALFTED